MPDIDFEPAALGVVQTPAPTPTPGELPPSGGAPQGGSNDWLGVLLLASGALVVGLVALARRRQDQC